MDASKRTFLAWVVRLVRQAAGHLLAWMEVFVVEAHHPGEAQALTSVASLEDHLDLARPLLDVARDLREVLNRDAALEGRLEGLQVDRDHRVHLDLHLD